MRSEKRTDSVTVRMTRAEKLRMEDSAAELGLSPSEFCRRRIAGDFRGGGDEIDALGERRRDKQRRRN